MYSEASIQNSTRIDISDADKEVLERINIPLYVVNPESMRIVWLNSSAQDYLGVGRGLLRRAEDGIEFPPELHNDNLRQRAKTWVGRLLAGERITEQITVIQQTTPLTLNCALSLQPLANGAPGILVQIIAHQPAEQSQPRIAQALLHTASMIALYDDTGELLFENPASRISRPADAEHLATRFCNSRDFHVLLEALEHNAQTNMVALMRSREGRRWYDLTARRGYDPLTAKRTVLFSAIDVTKRLEAEHEVRHIAHHDTLTSLPNRTFLEIEAERHLDEARVTQNGGALVFIDLDRFKTINDTLGHQVGDDLLVQVAKRLGEVTSGLGFTARLGGDEFVLLFAKLTDREILEEIAREILTHLSHPYHVRGHILQITPSLGITQYPEHGDTLETLMRKADLAMYKAKELGRNQFCFFDNSMEETAQERLVVETSLRNAIEYGEFEQHYQPRLNTTSNQIVGAECLLRWKHPTRGLISAGGFIDVAEESGHIDQISEWVAETAIRQQSKWITEGLLLNLSINLSASQFKRGDLSTWLTNIADHYRVPTHLIDLEITENLLLKDTDDIVDQLTRLRAAGFKLEIDDFGTGYSNLGYLQRYPINALKIDRTFISDKSKWPIVQMITQMGRLLDLTLVAEGIETTEQLAQIKSIRCHEYQGFLYSPAVPAHEIERMLREDQFDRRFYRDLSAGSL